ncbi:MAG: YitT family protein [Clostridia bacterium]|nr:YitT family protein [Clostridia bacterium]
MDNTALKKSSTRVWLKNEFAKLHWVNFILLTFAGIINATGVTLFLTPAGLYDGGFSGTSFFLSQVTPLSLSIFLLILNFPFFILGFKKLGLPFILYSLYTIGIYSLFAWIYQDVIPIDLAIAKEDLLLSAVFGGIISGIGSGITIRFGGAIDGVEVLGVLFAKKLNMSIGTFVMVYNAIFYIIAGAVQATVFSTPDAWLLALYSIIAYACGLKAVDFVVDGFDKAKSAFIISEKNDEIAEALSGEFGRGVTVLEAEGYYSKANKTIIYCVINRFEMAKLKEIIHGIDPHAFVAINDVTDSMSKNLRYSRFQKRATIQVEKDGVIQEITPVETTTEEVTTPADTTESAEN